MELFDLEEAKRESGLSTEELLRLEQVLNAELGHDQMMYELHLIRVLKAIKEGWVSLEQALSESVETPNK
ncbi:MAG: hypothetical protein PHZ21_00230 [Candidatus Bipolaricaulis sp.]|nr:hypothetical protein [Candidatus Thermoplasmatota archaeon]MDD5452701.1 hypothetical protein [Candidatus Bipolaricaulis sp.]